ncbi:MAG TPA: hypothetical protein VGI28_14140 [Stellaceae bacterium]
MSSTGRSCAPGTGDAVVLSAASPGREDTLADGAGVVAAGAEFARTSGLDAGETGPGVALSDAEESTGEGNGILPAGAIGTAARSLSGDGLGAAALAGTTGAPAVGAIAAADGPFATTAAAGSERVIEADAPANSKYPMPKKATIVATAAIPSPLKERTASVPSGSPVRSEGDGKAEEGTASGVDANTAKRDRNAGSCISRLLSELCSPFTALRYKRYQIACEDNRPNDAN